MEKTKTKPRSKNLTEQEVSDLRHIRDTIMDMDEDDQPERIDNGPEDVLDFILGEYCDVSMGEELSVPISEFYYFYRSAACQLLACRRCTT